MVLITWFDEKQANFLFSLLCHQSNDITDLVVLCPKKSENPYYVFTQKLEKERVQVRLYKYPCENVNVSNDNLQRSMEKVLNIIFVQFTNNQIKVNVFSENQVIYSVWESLVEKGFIQHTMQLVRPSTQEEQQNGVFFTNATLTIPESVQNWAHHTKKLRDNTNSFIWEPSRFQSAKLKNVYTQAKRFAKLNVPILILGERGTGKTTLASWIRLQSSFNKNLDSWPVVSCGQFGTNDMMRSELFGHAKGAFTGADNEKEGLLTKLNGDTLFLDEIGDISNNVQRMLIKAIEEGIYTPIGSTKTQKSKFRLISATNLSLDDLKKKLDLDFFDRISGFVLTMPSIREIPEELDWIWPKILEEAFHISGIQQRNIHQLQQTQLDTFIGEIKQLPLYGNIRDLFKIAWLFLACRNDETSPMLVAEAMRYSLDTFIQQSSVPVQNQAPIMDAFVNKKSLRLVPFEQVLDIQKEIKQLQSWFACELYELAKLRDRSPDKLTTVNKRTLQNWKKNS